MQRAAGRDGGPVELTRALSAAMAPTRQRASARDPGRVAQPGGDARRRPGLGISAASATSATCWRVASHATALRVIDSIDQASLERLRGAVAGARARTWKLGPRPAQTILDVDATLTIAIAHSAIIKGLSPTKQGADWIG
jgi:hypothetical protein